MGLLPKSIVKATRKNPKKIIIFGKPKSGKTTITAPLENNLIIDLESGSDFVDALKVKANNLNELRSIIKELDTESKNNNGNPVYKYITIDTMTKLEEMVMPLACKLYQDTTMGKNWEGDDVRKLANGAGYMYQREAFMTVLNQISKYCDTLILIGHTKDSMIDKAGDQLTERSVDLTGKTGGIIAADVDAIAYIYRKDNETILNFQSSDSLVAGSRCEHLRGKEIVVAKSDENGKLNIDWSQIFIKE